MLPQNLTRDQKLRALSIAAARAREQRRQGIVSDNKFAKYINDPIGFFTDELHENIWSKTREICEAVRDHDYVAVKSCHESSKSWTAARIACWWIAAHPPGEAFVVTSAPSAPQVAAILWREMRRAHRKGRLPGRMLTTEWKINDELVAIGRKPDDTSPTAFQGYHAQYMLVLFDEAGGMPSALWTAAETLVANEGGKIFVIGNPDDPNTEFCTICKPGSNYKVITISAFDTPNFTTEDVPDDLKRRLISRDWVESRKIRWGETNPLYLSKVLGQFPEDTPDALIKTSWVIAAVARTLDPIGPNELGVDVARSDRNNESVIFHRHGPVARLWKAMYTRDLMTLCGYVVEAVRETGATRIKIDDIGVGGGLTDRLLELHGEPRHVMNSVEVVPINVAKLPISDDDDEFANSNERFRNQRSELAWALRERFQEGAIDLDADLDTQAQICSIRYRPNSRGQVEVETKEDIAKRLAKLNMEQTESTSPDRFDALVLAFAEIRPAVMENLWSASHLMAAV